MLRSNVSLFHCSNSPTGRLRVGLIQALGGMSRLLHKLSHWLRQSPTVHAREIGVTTLSGLVALLDRFLQDALQYPLEWDDFISWENAVPAIEEFRVRLASAESLCLSNDPLERAEGLAVIVQQRNEVAFLVGLPAIAQDAG